MKNKLLYNQPGRIDDTIQAWEFIPFENPGKMIYNEAKGWTKVKTIEYK